MCTCYNLQFTGQELCSKSLQHNYFCQKYFGLKIGTPEEAWPNA